MSVTEAIFKTPDLQEFEQVKKLVEDFWLDNDDMQPLQFTLLSDNGKVVAFGRLRVRPDATELCTMGVAKEYQGNGYGEKMVKQLQHIATADLHLVTVIPDFFRKQGFEFVEVYPESIKQKAENCSTNYHTGEQYYVMKWKKK